MKNVRVFYEKKGRLKFVSHLDMNRFMSRLITKSKIPIWYTEGFNQHIYMNFAVPLSLGFEGFYEIMDIRLGGLKQRVLSCKRRIEQYINGEISEIPELCEVVLEKTNGIFWSRIISAGRISMHL